MAASLGKVPVAVAVPCRNLLPQFCWQFQSKRFKSRCNSLHIFSPMKEKLALQNALSEEPGVEVLEYPPIKPKYPPGSSWGNMDRKSAWIWHDLKAKISDELRDIDSRLNLFIKQEAHSVILDPINDHPASLYLRQFITKSHMLPWPQEVKKIADNEDELSTLSTAMPTPASNHMLNGHQSLNSVHVELLKNKLKQAVSDHLIFENEMNSVQNQKDSKSHGKLLFRCIVNAATTHFWKHYDHLRLCQYDEDVVVRALWHKNGIERPESERTRRVKEFADYGKDWIEIYIPEQYKIKHKSIPQMVEYIAEQDQTVMCGVVFDAMMRGHLPLPEIEPRLSNLSMNTPAPDLEYHLKSYGHTHDDFQLFKNIQAGSRRSGVTYSKGKKCCSLYRANDPCQFGQVGFLSTADTKEIEDKSGLAVAQRVRLGLGLTSSFTWLAAQALCQGFTELDDLTYPFVCQTVLSDGQNFSFLKYQLNTMQLWQDDDANNLVNLCWHTEEMPLYHSVENGHVNELNDEVLRHLAEMFLLAPVDSGLDLRPYVNDKLTDHHHKTDFIPEKIVREKVIREEKFII